MNKELCVVAGEIYGSDVRLSGKSIARIGTTTDSSGKPIKKEVEITYPLIFDGLVSAFGYNKDNINWAAKNFYTNWIQGLEGTDLLAYRSIRNTRQRILSPDYTNPRSITIIGKDAMEVDYGDGARKFGKEDGGLLYVPEEGKVCFFPTIGGGPLSDWSGDCDGHKEGLEQDCFDSKTDKIYELNRC